MHCDQNSFIQHAEFPVTMEIFMRNATIRPQQKNAARALQTAALCCLIAILHCAGPVGAADWEQFRGPNATGVAAEGGRSLDSAGLIARTESG